MSVGPKYWNVLLVDDEPDVLEVSKIALRDMTIDNLPLNVLTAGSKAEAIELLDKETSWLSHLAVAFIDVVMESDTAGLELCKYIREKKQNQISQLYIRTGQPGVAPERTVIDQYDISGYFTKAEVTEDKLYSVIRSGVRQYNSTQILQASLTMLNQLVDVGDSKAALVDILRKLGQGFYPGESPAENGVHFTINDESIVGPLGWEPEAASALKNKLEGADGISLGTNGDKYVYDSDGNLLVKVDGTDSKPEVVNLVKYQNRLPESRILTVYAFSKTLATLWARAA
ncbi:MAG: response regulator [Chloroflexota bacterium]